MFGGRRYRADAPELNRRRRATASIRFDHSPAARAAPVVLAEPSRGTGTVEADYLNGEIVLLGREHGVPTPVNDVLQRTANAFARERREPGSMSVAELTALIDAAS